MSEFRWDFWNNPLFEGVTNLWNKGKDVVKQAGSWLGDTVNSLTGKRANDISAQNLQAQKEELDYQHALQEQIFEREDTGYQRAVADARAAGLSAASISGPSNAGGVVSTTAPQQDINNIGVENGLNALNMINSVIGQISQLSLQNKLADSQIAQQAANTQKTLSEIEDLKLRNPITRDILSQQYKDLQSASSKSDWLWNNGEKQNFLDLWSNNSSNSKRNYLQYLRDFNDFTYMSTYGLTDSMTAAERAAMFQDWLKGSKDPTHMPFSSYRFNQDKNVFELNNPKPFYWNNKKGEYFSSSGDYIDLVLNKELRSLWTGVVFPLMNKLPIK